MIIDLLCLFSAGDDDAIAVQKPVANVPDEFGQIVLVLGRGHALATQYLFGKDERVGRGNALKGDLPELVEIEHLFGLGKDPAVRGDVPAAEHEVVQPRVELAVKVLEPVGDVLALAEHDEGILPEERGNAPPLQPGLKVLEHGVGRTRLDEPRKLVIDVFELDKGAGLEVSGVDVPLKSRERGGKLLGTCKDIRRGRDRDLLERADGLARLRVKDADFGERIPEELQPHRVFRPRGPDVENVPAQGEARLVFASPLPPVPRLREERGEMRVIVIRVLGKAQDVRPETPCVRKGIEERLRGDDRVLRLGKLRERGKPPIGKNAAGAHEHERLLPPDDEGHFSPADRLELPADAFALDLVRGDEQTKMPSTRKREAHFPEGAPEDGHIKVVVKPLGEVDI